MVGRRFLEWLCTGNVDAGGTLREDCIDTQEDIRLELTLSQADPSLQASPTLTLTLYLRVLDCKCPPMDQV